MAGGYHRSGLQQSTGVFVRFEKKRIAADFRALAESLGAGARMLDAQIAVRPIVSDEDERAAALEMQVVSDRVAQAIANVRAKVR